MVQARLCSGRGQEQSLAQAKVLDRHTWGGVAPPERDISLHMSPDKIVQRSLCSARWCSRSGQIDYSSSLRSSARGLRRPVPSSRRKCGHKRRQRPSTHRRRPRRERGEAGRRSYRSRLRRAALPGLPASARPASLRPRPASSRERESAVLHQSLSAMHRCMVL